MKHNFCIGVTAIIAFCLFSCGGNAEAQAEKISSAKEISMVNANNKSQDEYKVVNGLIKPINGRPTIVDFSATWCGPCKQLKPIFARLEKEFKDRINFVTIDVDENVNLSQNYNVTSVPTLIFLDKEGNIQNTIIGFRNYDQLLAAINTYFGF